MRYSSQSVALDFLKGKKAFLFKSLTQATDYVTSATEVFNSDTHSADDNNDDNNDDGDNDDGDNEEDEYFEDEDLGTFEVDIDSYNSSASDDS